MATKTQDYTAMMKDMMGAFPVDQGSVESMFKSQSAFAEKMSAVAIDAAQQSTNLSAKWTQDTLSKVSDITKARVEPADYAKAITDFATASAESAAEHMAAFADIAKKVQTETLELMLSMGKDMSSDMQNVAQKATDDMTSASKKATSSAK